jgi:hypothetical protein
LAEDGMPALSLDDFLRMYRLKNLSVETAGRWMKYLGFKYTRRKMSYYVDGHERKDVVADRKLFCERYLKVHEIRTFRWLQLTHDQADILNISKAEGYHYVDENKKAMIEVHVDAVTGDLDNKDGESPGGLLLRELLKGSKFGGNLSVRKHKDQLPLIIIGQDECIVNQYLFPGRSWMGPEGQTVLLPKSQGDGVMLSSFVSRDFGWDLFLSDADLIAINELRAGQDYVESEAAMAVHGKADKRPLTEGPFLILFNYGANKDGYWNNNHMALQLEDCLDCCR